jgi:hypothetical protein
MREEPLPVGPPLDTCRKQLVRCERLSWLVLARQPHAINAIVSSRHIEKVVILLEIVHFPMVNGEDPGEGTQG